MYDKRELTLEMIIRFGPRAAYRWRYEERGYGCALQTYR